MRTPKNLDVRKPNGGVRDYPGREALEAAVRPLVEPVARVAAGAIVQRLTGFWVLWHTHGGTVAGVVAGTGISRGGVYRQLDEFERVFGVKPDEWHPEVAAMLRVLGPAFFATLPRAEDES